MFITVHRVNGSLFRDDMDRNYFVKLLCRHLVENYDEDSPVRAYAVEIIAYCLMGTHFHLLLNQEEDADAVTGYMRSVSTAYSMYYNKKYKSKGHVFQSNFRASHILQESYLAHITRYIHLNPRTYTTWKWSSYTDYIGKTDTAWVHNERLQEPHEIGSIYAKFTEEWRSTDRRIQYAELRHTLAD